MPKTTTLAEKPKRKRVSQACNACRKSHLKCEKKENEKKCRLCFRRGVECIFENKNKKRGRRKQKEEEIPKDVIFILLNLNK